MFLSGAVLSLTLAVSASPGSSPVDAEALTTLRARAKSLDTDVLLVMRDGKVLVEDWYDGKPRKIQSMSITKSVAALAIGRLMQTGRIESLDVPLARWFPEWKQGRKQQITIRHVLTQTSGLQDHKMTGVELNSSPDLVQLALCAELAHDPGSRFFYSNKASNLLSALVERISGQKLDAYLAAEVFRPLGIEDFEWGKDPAGHPLAMSGLEIRANDLAKLGQLMLQQGRWGKTQILSRAWVADATKSSEQQATYGFMWWIIPKRRRVAIDDALLSAWAADDADPRFLAAMRPLVGPPLPPKVFFGKVETQLKDLGGIQAWHDNTWRKGRADGRVVVDGTLGFRADGWQGQALIVLPARGVVVVRMREPSEGNTAEENTKYGFHEVVKLASEL